MSSVSPTRDQRNRSPEAQAKYRHNPYSFDVSYAFVRDEPEQPTAAMMETMLPHGTRHTRLWQSVSFVPFPQETFVVPVEAFKHTAEPMVRVFLGQLPYFVTDQELAWICYVLGGGQVVLQPERIMKRHAGGERLPTGCIHGYATPDAISIMAMNMHKRMLIDDTGIWHAQTEEELRALSAYVAEMKADKSKRIPGRPYDSVVVQEATSTFVPNYPVPLTEFPTEQTLIMKSQQRRVSPPPPAYGDAMMMHQPAAGADFYYRM